MTTKSFDATRRMFLASTGTMTAAAALGSLAAGAAKAEETPAAHGHVATAAPATRSW